MKFLLIFVIFIVRNSIDQVDGLYCYECTKYYRGINCFNPDFTGNVGFVDCRHSGFIVNNYPGAQYQCVTFIDRYRNNQTEIVRRCALKTDGKFCNLHRNEAQINGVKVVDCYSCKDDYCNGAIEIRAKCTLLLSIFALLFMK